MLGNLGIRMFNALGAGVKLLFSGYNQASALQLRDVLETVFLLDYFSTAPDLITQWRTMPEAKRKEKFKPYNVRVALDNRDGFTEKKRAAAYALFSKLAGHATPEGMVMLVPVPGGKHVHCGPFLEETTLLAVLTEAAKLAVQAAGNFSILVKNERLSQMEARLTYMDAHADWVERFAGTRPNRAAIEECRALLAKLRRG